MRFPNDPKKIFSIVQFRKNYFILFISFIFWGATSFASPIKNAPATSPVIINPQTLKSMLLEQNVGLLIQLNNVYKAKTQVTISRTRLLPSVNLGTLVSSASSFGLASVSMLMPFLLPSNWLNLTQNQHLLNAQVKAYYISQLNTYSSAYSVYLTIVGDISVREVLYKQYQNYKDIEDLIAAAVDAGMMNQDQLLQARSQTQLSEILVSQLDTLIIEEKAAIREMLALPLTREIVFEINHVSASPSETLALPILLERANARSPELAQLNSLVLAANAAKWSTAFGFLTGASLSTVRINGGAFGNIGQIGTVNLGFSYFPQVKLADYNIDEIKLQKKQVALDQAQLLEVTIGSIKEASKQYELGISAEKNLQLFYDGEVEKFRAGMTDLLHVLYAGKSLTVALTNKVSSQIHLDTLRVSLNRILLEDKFTQVAACEVKRREGGFFDRLGRVFNSAEDISLDKACGPQTKN